MKPLCSSQKKLLLGALCVAGAMLLVPPWTETLDVPGHIHRERFAGYYLLFEPPQASEPAIGVSVNHDLLLTQLAFLCAIAIGGLIYLKDSTVKRSAEPFSES